MFMSRRFVAAGVIALAAGASAQLQTPATPQTPSPQEAPRPIAAGDSLWTEELTWMEVRDAVRAGKTTVLIGTGGVEQNGPYLAGGKHNFVLATVMPEIAKAIGNTLIAPIVKFVPEGAIEPTPRGHMAYSGTISLEPATFEALLTDICRSYRAHGFKDLILIGDSGGNQTGMRNVAEALNKNGPPNRRRRACIICRVLHRRSVELRLPEIAGHRPDRQVRAGRPPGSPHRHTQRHARRYLLRGAGAVQDPKLIRAEQRIKAGLFTLHGVDLSPVSKTVELGKKLAVYRAGITAKAFQNSLKKLRAGGEQ